MFAKLHFRVMSCPSTNLPASLAKSHGIISFADPQPLTPVESHRYKKHRGYPHHSIFQRSGLQTFQRGFHLSPFFSNPSTLFRTHQKRNSFVIKRCRTLCRKHPRWGEGILLTNLRSSQCLRVSVAIPATHPTTRLSEALPVPRECIRRTIGAGEFHRQAFLRPHFCVLDRVGGCDG